MSSNNEYKEIYDNKLHFEFAWEGNLISITTSIVINIIANKL
jgi:hypothetical protein